MASRRAPLATARRPPALFHSARSVCRSDLSATALAKVEEKKGGGKKEDGKKGGKKEEKKEKKKGGGFFGKKK